jgi:FMN reductase
MADILLISGSPTASSRSGALLTYSQNWLHNKSSFETVLVSVRDFPADDLVLAKYDSPAFDSFKQQVSNAAGIIVSTPIYKAPYTGSLKALLGAPRETVYSFRLLRAGFEPFRACANPTRLSRCAKSSQQQNS